MALSTYAELQAAVANWLNRTDLGDRAKEFIALAEAKLKRELRRAVVRTAAFSVSAEATVLPSDCAELRTARPRTSSRSRDLPLTLTTPEHLAVVRAGLAATGRPVAGYVADGTLVVAPVPDATYTFELTYYQRLVPLSDANTANPTLAEAPDLYLYGALCEAEPYLENDERLPMWQGRFQKALDDMNLAREREEYRAARGAATLPVVFG